MLKWISSGPAPFAVLLVAMIASWSEILPSAPLSASNASIDVVVPSTVSLVVVTIKLLSPETLTDFIAALLVPPSPSVSTNRTVRLRVEGSTETFW